MAFLKASRAIMRTRGVNTPAAQYATQKKAVATPAAAKTGVAKVEDASISRRRKERGAISMFGSATKKSTSF